VLKKMCYPSTFLKILKVFKYINVYIIDKNSEIFSGAGEKVLLARIFPKCRGIRQEVNL
jgi:hypothetical protein